MAESEERSITGQTLLKADHMILPGKSYHDVVAHHGRTEVSEEAFRIGKRVVPGSERLVPVELYFTASGDIAVSWIMRFEVTER